MIKRHHILWPWLLGLFLYGCMGNPPATRKKPQVVQSMAQALAEKNPKIQHISAQKLKQWIENNRSLTLVDARSHKAWKISHIPGALPYNDFSSESNSTDTIVVYDTIGVRAIEVLKNQTFPTHKKYNLRGGILSWIHQGYGLIGEQGKDSKQVYLESEAWNLLPETYRKRGP